jgi:paraquat-inducible protein B
MQEMYENEVIQEAVWQEKKKGISTVWIVPIVALVIGAWLMFQSYNEKGPTIDIYFKSAAGIQAGKTVIKYKDIEIGKVTEVTFSKGLKRVRVTAELKKNMKPYLSENTRFWVVQAKLGMGEVQGLDTLLSGVYIVMDPQKGQKSLREFKGLDQIPVVNAGEKGHTYILKAKTIGSLSVGSPIYYRKLKAGSVASYKLDDDGQFVTLEVFVKSPFDKLINDKTRFYNVSGIRVSMNADGVDIQTDSLVSLMMGGLAFDNFRSHGKGKPVPQNYVFDLYDSRKDAQKVHYKRELYFWVYFDESIRGLSVGAPVEFRGLKIGEVVNFSLIGNADTAEFKIPILIKVEPERFTIIGKSKTKDNDVNVPVFEKLLKKGFRAQLKSGNLITGELYIDLNLYPDLPPAPLKKEYGFYIIPSIPATIESLKNNLQSVLKEIASIPFEKIGKEMKAILEDIHTKTMPQVNSSVAHIDSLMRDTDKMMKSLNRNYLDSNSEINKKLIKLLDEMTRTSKSVKNLTDYLERHPESLIKGK